MKYIFKQPVHFFSSILTSIRGAPPPALCLAVRVYSGRGTAKTLNSKRGLRCISAGTLTHTVFALRSVLKKDCQV